MAEEGATDGSSVSVSSSDRPPLARPSGVRAARWNLAAAVGLGLLLVWAFCLGVALLKGPLSTEALVRGNRRLPAFVRGLVAIGAAAPQLLVTFRSLERGRMATVEKVLAVLATVFGIGAAAGSGAWPRYAFDGWERAMSTTAMGVPWAGIATATLAAAAAGSFAFALRRLLLERGAADSRRLTLVLAAVAVMLGAVPTAASVYLATGSRLLPVGAVDDPWVSAASESCPPGPPVPATSAR